MDSRELSGHLSAASYDALHVQGLFALRFPVCCTQHSNNNQLRITSLASIWVCYAINTFSAKKWLSAAKLPGRKGRQKRLKTRPSPAIPPRGHLPSVSKQTNKPGQKTCRGATTDSYFRVSFSPHKKTLLRISL